MSNQDLTQFNQIIEGLNQNPEHQAQHWVHPVTGECRIQVKYQGKHAGFIVNPDSPVYEGSFKKIAKLPLDGFLSDLNPVTPQNDTLPLDTPQDGLTGQKLANPETLQHFIHQDVYLVSIEISGGVSPVALDWNHLGLDSELIDDLKASKAHKIKIPLFDSLNKAVTAIRNLRGAIYSKFLIRSAPWWYCLDSQVDKFLSEYEDLKQFADIKKREITSKRDQELQIYLASVRKILENIIQDESTVEYLLWEYARLFPTVSDIEERFEVQLTSFIKVPSLISQIKKDSEEAQIIAENVRSQALINAQNEYSQRVHDALSSAIDKTTNELYELLGDTLQKITQCSNTPKAREMCQRALERVEILAEFNPVLGDIKNAFSDTVQAHAKELDLKHALDSVKIALNGHSDLLANIEPDTRKTITRFML